MVDVVLNKDPSAERSARLLKNAHLAGAANLDDLQIKHSKKHCEGSAAENLPEFQMACAVPLQASNVQPSLQ